MKRWMKVISIAMSCILAFDPAQPAFAAAADQMSRSNEVALQAASKSDASDSEDEAEQTEADAPDAADGDTASEPEDASEGESTTQNSSVEALAVAEDEQLNGLKYSKNSDGTITISGYEGSDSSVVIPATIDGCTVTSIGGDAFSGCTALASISLPDGVKSIGGHAFASAAARRSRPSRCRTASRRSAAASWRAPPASRRSPSRRA